MIALTAKADPLDYLKPRLVFVSDGPEGGDEFKLAAFQLIHLARDQERFLRDLQKCAERKPNFGGFLTGIRFAFKYQQFRDIYSRITPSTYGDVCERQREWIEPLVNVGDQAESRRNDDTFGSLACRAFERAFRNYLFVDIEHKQGRTKAAPTPHDTDLAFKAVEGMVRNVETLVEVETIKCCLLAYNNLDGLDSKDTARHHGFVELKRDLGDLLQAYWGHIHEADPVLLAARIWSDTVTYGFDMPAVCREYFREEISSLPTWNDRIMALNDAASLPGLHGAVRKDIDEEIAMHARKTLHKQQRGTGLQGLLSDK